MLLLIIQMKVMKMKIIDKMIKVSLKIEIKIETKIEIAIERRRTCHVVWPQIVNYSFG